MKKPILQHLLWLIVLLVGIYQPLLAQTCQVATSTPDNITPAGNTVTQTFKPCSSGLLNSIGFWSASTGLGYTFTVSGPTGNSSSPSMSAPNGTFSVSFTSTPYYLSAGETYTITISRPAGQTAFSLRYINNGALYPDGAASMGGDLYFVLNQNEFQQPDLSPAHQATEVSRNTPLVLDFGQNMVAGTGNLTLENLSTATVTPIPVSELVYTNNGTVEIPLISSLNPGEEYSIYYPLGAFKTQSSNINVTALAQGDWTFTTTNRPAVDISASVTTITNQNPFTLTFQFTEDVSNFMMGDIDVTNAGLANFSGSGSVYSVEVLPTADGLVSVLVPQNVAQAVGPLLNTASNLFTIQYDGTFNLPQLNASVGSEIKNPNFTLTYEFDEDISGLTASDFQLISATIRSFNLSGRTATLQIQATAQGQVSVTLPAGVVQDLAENNNQELVFNTNYMADLLDGLRVYYAFDNQSRYDVVGNGANLTKLGNNAEPQSVNDRFNRANGAYYFTGVGTLVGTPNLGGDITAGGGFSISTWFQPYTNMNAGTGFRNIYRQPGRTALNYNNIGQLVWSVGAVNIVYDTIFTAGEWYHLVVTGSAGGAAKFFINGKELSPNGTLPATINADNVQMSIGSDYTGSTVLNILNGAIDEFRVYRRQLAAVEVDSLLNSPAFDYELRTTAICQGESVVIDGNEIDTAGIFNFIEAGTTPNWVTLPLTVDALPTLNAYASRTEICVGEGVKLSAISNANISWNHDQANGTWVYPEATTTYTVTATNANNCSVSEEVTITVNESTIEPQTLNTTNQLFCSETSISLEITTSGSQSGYNYYLLNESNQVAVGPLVGDGNALTFPLNNLNTSQTYRLKAENTIAGPTSGLAFDGVNDRVIIPYNSSLAFTNAFTIEMWINPVASSAKRYFSNYNGTGTVVLGEIVIDGFSTIQNGRGLRFFMATGTGSQVVAIADNVLTLGEWQHIAAVFNAGSMVLYVNGSQVATQTYPNANASNLQQTWVLGEDRTPGTAEWFNGKMDEFRFWKVARTPAQINADKDRTLEGLENGLMIYYPFNQPVGSSFVIDQSQNSNHGTLTDMDVNTAWTTGILESNTGCSLVFDQELRIQVGDTDGPSIQAQALELRLNANGTASISANLFDNGTSDSCTGTDGIIFSLNKSTFNCDDLGENTLILTTTDPEGNTSTAEVTLTVLPYQEDYNVSLVNEVVCIGEDANIELENSNQGVSYFVVNADTDETVAGPFAGTGEAMSLPVLNIQEAANYKVRAEVDGTGESKHAINFTGAANQNINATNNTRGITNSFSISTWVKSATNDGSIRGIVTKRQFTGYTLYMVNGNISFQVNYNTGTFDNQFVNSGVGYVNNQWHHVVVRFSPTAIDMYVDGILTQQKGLNNVNVNMQQDRNLFISGGESMQNFIGSLDQVAIFNRFISNEEIAFLYNNCVPNTMDNLTGLFNFNEADGTTLIDESPIGINATLGAGFDPIASRLVGVSPSCPISGCPVELSQTVSIQTSIDTEAPEIITQSYATTLSQLGEITLTGREFDNGTNDDCTPSEQLQFSLSQTTFDCSDLGEKTLVLTVTDRSGNVSTQEVNLTVNSFVEERSVTSLDDNICGGVATEIILASSQVGVEYTLINTSTDQVIGQSKLGNGQDLTFASGSINSNTTFGFSAKPNYSSSNAGLSFDGVDDKVRIPYTVSQNFATQGAITFEAWIYPTKNEYSRIVTSFSGSTVEQGTMILDTYASTDAVSGRALRLYYRSALNTHILEVPQVLALNDWNHVAFVIESANGGQMVLYHNGVQIGSMVINASLLAHPRFYNLGEDEGGSANEFFQGKMDEVRFWNTARSAEQIQANLNTCLNGSETGLVIYYNFDNGSGSTVQDLTGNGNTGNLLNFDTQTAWSGGKLNCTAPTNCTVTLNNTVTVNIADTEAPNFEVQTLTVALNAQGIADFSFEDLIVSVTDNCNDKASISFEFFPSSLTCENLGENTITVTATDLAGNSSEKEVIVTVLDNLVPTVITRNIILQLDENDTPITITEADLDNGSFDNCGPVSMSLSKYTFGPADAGTNEVVVTVTDPSGNQSAATAIVTVEGNKQVQTLTFNAIGDKTYGSAAFNLSATSSIGSQVQFASADENIVTINGNTATITGTGTVIITASAAGSETHYESQSDQTITVNKAVLTASVNNASRSYGEPNPSFEINYSGFVYNENESVILTAPSISTNATESSDVGNYEVSLNGAEADNYNFTYASGILSILKANQTVSVSPIDDVPSTQGSVSIEAIASSGLTPSYTLVSGPATIDGNVLTFTSDNGLIQVDITQDGNDNYNAAPVVSLLFNIFNPNKQNQTITIQPIANKFVTSASFVVEASTTSGLALSYAIFDGPATINGNVISLTGQTGNVTVQVSQAGDDTFNPTTAFVSFSVLANPCVNFYFSSVGSSNVSCFGGSNGSISFSFAFGTAPYNVVVSDVFSANTNNAFVALSSLIAGNYPITVTDANSCVISTQITIEQPDPIEITGTVTQTRYFSNTGSINITVQGGTAPYSFSWSNGSQAEDLNNLPAGNYTITVTDNVGCVAEATFEVTVDVISSISELNQAELKLYPNPANNQAQLQLELTHPASISLEIVNTLGERIWLKNLGTVNQINESLELQNYTKGLYLVRIISSDGIRTEKLLIQ